MSQPLNPLLYERLREEFGEVAISHPGVEASMTLTSDMNGRQRLQMITSGEYYLASCPFCNDTRKRLWVNHRWGAPDDQTGTSNLWLAICYNEQCLSIPGRPQELYERVYGFKNLKLRGQQIVILPGRVDDGVLTKAELPGEVIKLEDLPLSSHPCTYLKSRGYDPHELGREFNLSYCVNALPEYPTAHGRIVIPVMMNGDMVGWQCRYVGDVDWKLAKIPKYYNKPGMAGRLMLYNYDNALKSDHVVVCEGPSDVWTMGSSAVCLMGKNASPQQLMLLSTGWEGGTIIVLLDGDAEKDSTKLYNRIQEHFRGATIRVTLPDGKDPGDFSREMMWEFISVEASRQGVDYLSRKRSTINERAYKNWERHPSKPGTDMGRAIESTGSEIPDSVFTSP